MGTMADMGMPVGLTFAGRVHSDTAPYAAVGMMVASTPARRPRTEVAVKLELLTPGIEVGLVTTDLDADGAEAAR